MKFFHLADLHIGKMVNGFSMLEDQAHILDVILEMAAQEQPDALVLAGDIYDRSLPGAEAVQLYDRFLTQAAQLGVPVLVVAGNHDSAERLGFAGQLLEKSGVYSFGPCTGAAHTVTLGAGNAAVDFHLLPFVRPATLRPYVDSPVESYHDAVRLALEGTALAPGRPHVLVAHQFVVAGGHQPEVSDSELRMAGGLEEVDVSLFEGFAYVALGHLHRPQQVGRATVRYAGSPLKYSFSEAGHQKSVTVVELEGGEAAVRLLPLEPLRDMREIEGELEDLLQPLVVQAANPQDYLRVTLRDEQEQPDAIGKLRRAYPNVMELRYRNLRSEAAGVGPAGPDIRQQSPLELFSAFYEEQNGAPPNAEQLEMLAKTTLGKEVAE